MALLQRTGRFLGFTNFVTVATGDTEILAIPPLDAGHQISVTAIPGSNTALVEHTTSPDADVAASATWQEWPSGSVTSTTSDTIVSPVTGLRFSATGGQCKFEVVI
jgi:hypothetical protein